MDKIELDRIGKSLPDYAVCPGEILLDVLEQRSMTPTYFAEQIGMGIKTMTGILMGEVPLTSKMASAFERVLGVPASLWMNAEKIYRSRRTMLEHLEQRSMLK